MEEPEGTVLLPRELTGGVPEVVGPLVAPLPQHNKLLNYQRDTIYKARRPNENMQGLTRKTQVFRGQRYAIETRTTTDMY